MSADVLSPHPFSAVQALQGNTVRFRCTCPHGKPPAWWKPRTLAAAATCTSPPGLPQLCGPVPIQAPCLQGPHLHHGVAHGQAASDLSTSPTAACRPNSTLGPWRSGPKGPDGARCQQVPSRTFCCASTSTDLRITAPSRCRCPMLASACIAPTALGHTALVDRLSVRSKLERLCIHFFSSQPAERHAKPCARHSLLQPAPGRSRPGVSAARPMSTAPALNVLRQALRSSGV